MVRKLFLLLGLCVCLASIGCAIPVGGPYGGLACDSCGDCDGGYVGGHVGGHVLPYGPLAALRQAKRNLVCGGGGCGEVYHGEWSSYPPDCVDPCVGDSYAGCSAGCGPAGCAACLAPGALLPRNIVPALYGKRIYQSYDAAGCGSCGDCGGGCSDCGGPEYVDEGGAMMHPSGCNCGGHATSSPTPAVSSTRSNSTMVRGTTAPPSRAVRTPSRGSEMRTRTR